MFKKEMWMAVFTFIGLIIGAGIFAIPYVIEQAGFLTGLVDMILLAAVVIYVCLCLGEVVLRTKNKHQLTGLAEKYLGKEGKIIMFATVIFSLYWALIAYAIGAGDALQALFGWNPLYSSLIFIIILGLVLLTKLRVFESFESIFSPLKILIILLLIAMTLPFVKLANISHFSIGALPIPYGVLLFALTGFSVIPDMAWGLKNKKVLKNSIIIGIITSAIIYLLFAFAVVGVLGNNTAELSTVALGQALGKNMVLLANIFAVLALGTAFMAVGFALKDNYILDYKINKNLAWVGVIIIPIIFVLIKKFSFVKIIDIVGIIGTGISLLAILLMHPRAVKYGDKEPAFKIKNHKIVKWAIILLVIFGIVYNLFMVI